MEPITLGLVDNDEITLEAMRQGLDHAPWCEVLWTADCGRKALQLTCEDEQWPDVLLLDMGLNDVPGEQVCRIIRAETNRMPVLAMSAYPIDLLAQRAADAGAQGIIAKAHMELFATACMAVAQGGTYNMQLTTRVMFEDCRTAHERLKSSSRTNFEKLSEQEAAVLGMLIDGKSYDQIAKSLNVKPVTARTYMARAMAKLDAHTIAQAAVRWMNMRQCDYLNMERQ